MPLPIGAVTLICAFALGFLASIFSRRTYLTVFTPAGLFYFHVFITLPWVLLLLLGSMLSIARIAQIILPLIILSLVTFPKIPSDQIRVMRWFSFVVIGVGIAHVISIFRSAESLLYIHSWWDFSFMYGWLIYQALVAYAASLTLFFLFLVAVLFRNMTLKRAKISLSNMILMISILSYLFIIAASGRRSLLIELGGSFLLVSTLSLANVITRMRVSPKVVLLYIVLSTGVGVAVYYMYTAGLFMRFSDWLVRDSATYDRADQHGAAIEFFAENPLVLILGGGAGDRPGFHNYLFDQLYRIGLVGFTYLAIVAGYLISRIKSKMEYECVFSRGRYIFSLMLVVPLLLQSTVNSSLTQPYYFINFFAVTFLIAFILFQDYYDAGNIRARPHRVY